MCDAVYQSLCLWPGGEEPVQCRAPEDAVSRQEWEAALVALRGQGGPSLCKGVTGLYGTAGGRVNLGRCLLLGQVGTVHLSCDHVGSCLVMGPYP